VADSRCMVVILLIRKDRHETRQVLGRDVETRVRCERLRLPLRVWNAHMMEQTREKDCRRGAYGTSTSEGMAVVRPRPSPLLSACARPRLQYGAPLSQGSATLWHGAISLPTSLPVRGYGRTDAVRRAASAAWSRATFFVLACQATSKRSPTTGSAPTTDSRAMLAAIRRSTRRGAPRRMAS
jgi:hypothetical protein